MPAWQHFLKASEYGSTCGGHDLCYRSTTLVSLDVQLSGTPALPAARPLAIARVTGANSLYGTTISYH
nr:hypothetical protein [Erwinia rhapontici]